MSKNNEDYIDFLGIIPKQYTGKEIKAGASVDLNNPEQANGFYTVVKKRLLNVDEWDKLAKITSTRFTVTDKSGNPLNRMVRKGDYLKIEIPGPANNEGDGYDWVEVEELKEVSEREIKSIGFRVRPVANPTNSEKTVAHFYDKSATSSFIVTLQKSKITAAIIDRNIKPNDKGETIIDKIRNTIIGVGALAGFSKIQWQNLAERLIETDSKE